MAPGGYPVVLDLRGRLALVAGGGAVAERRVRGLAEAGARVRVVAPALTPGLAELAAAGAIEVVRRAWQPADLEGAVLAVAATDDPEANRGVAEQARRRGLLVNVADDPSRGNFTVPAVLRRGELLLAVGTSGRAPGLAGALRRRLEASFGPEWAQLASMLGEERGRLPAAGDGAAWDDLLNPELLEAARTGKHQIVREKIREWQSSLPA